MKLVCESISEYDDLKQIKELTYKFVRGNEDFLNFTNDDGENLIHLIDKYPDIKKESINWIKKNSVNGFLYRGLKDDKDQFEEGYVENEDATDVTNIDSFTTDINIAKEFAGLGGTIISSTLDKLEKNILLAVEVVLKDIRKPRKSDSKIYFNNFMEYNINSSPEELEEAMMSNMIWTQKEVLVKTTSLKFSKKYLKTFGPSSEYNKRGVTIKYKESGPSPEYNERDVRIITELKKIILNDKTLKIVEKTPANILAILDLKTGLPKETNSVVNYRIDLNFLKIHAINFSTFSLFSFPPNIGIKNEGFNHSLNPNNSDKENAQILFQSLQAERLLTIRLP